MTTPRAGLAPPPRFDPRVLYVHPYGHESPETLPAGAIAVANCLERPPLGLFAEEVERAHVERAEIVLLDVHWFLPLAALRGLVADLRRLRPGLTVVLGGITSAFFAEQVLAEGSADYVMTGDTEVSVAELVARTLRGERALDLPNAWRAGAPPPRRVRLPRAAFDRLDWLTIDWFPTFARLVDRHHQRYREHGARLGAFDRFAWQSTWFPYLPLVRGCLRACSHCCGSYAGPVLGRGLRSRSATGLARDLRRLEAEGRTFVNLYANDARFLRVYGEALGEAFRARPLAMDALVFFCGTPDERALEGLRAAFAGEVCLNVVHPFDLEPRHGEPPRDAQEVAFLDGLERMSRLARTSTVVFRLHTEPEPALVRIAEAAPNLRLRSGRDWVVDVPDVRAVQAGTTAAEHFADIRAGSRRFLISLLLGTLVPELSRTMSRRLDLDATHDDWRRHGFDTLEQALLAEYARRVCLDRAHGFVDVLLEWRRGELEASLAAGWARPGAALAGHVAWDGTLTGLGWEGSVAVAAGEALAVAPVPTVSLRDGSRVDLGTWERARVPAVRVASGPAREVRLGGRRDARGLALWLEDRGRRTELRLPFVPRQADQPAARRPGGLAREVLEAISAERIEPERLRALRRPGPPRR